MMAYSIALQLKKKLTWDYAMIDESLTKNNKFNLLIYYIHIINKIQYTISITIKMIEINFNTLFFVTNPIINITNNINKIMPKILVSAIL